MKLSRRIGYAVTYYLGTAILKTWRIKNINKEPYNKSRKEGRRPVLVLWHDSLLFNFIYLPVFEISIYFKVAVYS